MDEFKLVKEESFESIARYLNILYSITDMNNPLAFVTCDYKKYMITKVDDEQDLVNQKYVILYNDNNKIQVVGFFYGIDNYTLQIDDTVYRVANNGIVATENTKSKFKQQLLCTDTIETNPIKNYMYGQMDSLNRRALYTRYLINNNQDYRYVLPYLSSKTPNDVTYVHGIIPVHNSRVLVDDKYYKYVRFNNDTVVLLPFQEGITVSDLNDYYQSLGFNTSVPQEMIDLYSGNNKKVKTLKRVADIYRKNTLK